MKKFLITVFLTAGLCAGRQASCGAAAGPEVDFDRGAGMEDIMRRVGGQPVPAVEVEVVRAPGLAKAASVVPAWIDPSKLSFVSVTRNADGYYAAILRYGLFSTREMLVLSDASGKARVIFTEYSGNPMGEPKNKEEADLRTSAARLEIAGILREAQKNKPVQSDMEPALNGLLLALGGGVPAGYVKSAGGAACPAGYEKVLSCVSAPKPGDSEIAAGMFNAVDVCARGEKVSLTLSADGEVQPVKVDKVIVRAGGVEYQVNEPRFNFIVNGGMAPGVPRRGTLQLFLGDAPLAAGFACK